MSRSIQPIPSASVHRITSGQVIVDLQTAVKELIENALDAGATSIDVRFRDYGSTSIEVIDNGCGISNDNFASLARKHHTSKLESFDDLAHVATFGFRGEALASLCQLADVTLHTATSETAPVGILLSLSSPSSSSSSSSSGSVEKKQARQVGTTVTVSNLFRGLPVRRKEFEKNVKREYTKTLSLLQAYTLITNGVRWLISHQGKSVVSVRSTSPLANVAALFGSKFAQTLVAIDTMQISDQITVNGLISKPLHGSGRTLTDRQFYYINGRPFDPPNRLGRAINEVYRSFNPQQAPFVLFNLQLATDRYDVNVSPDKRTVFLHDETALVNGIRQALEQRFEPTRGVLPVRQIGIMGGLDRFLDSKPQNSQRQGYEEMDQEIEEIEQESEQIHQESEQIDQDAEQISQEPEPIHQESEKEQEKQETIQVNQHSEILPHSRSESICSSPNNETILQEPSTSSLPVLSPVLLVDDSVLKRRIDSVLDPLSFSKRIKESLSSSLSLSRSQRIHSLRRFEAPGSQRRKIPMDEEEEEEEEEVEIEEEEEEVGTEEEEEKVEVEGEEIIESNRIEPSYSSGSLQSLSNGIDYEEEEEEEEEETEPHSSTSCDHSHPNSHSHEDITPPKPPPPTSIPITSDSIVQSISLSLISSRLSSHYFTSSPPPTSTSTDTAIHSNPFEQTSIYSNDPSCIDSVLSRSISKSDFTAMKIIGQFNLGFIIVRLHTNTTDDLFIIDQHASDEKFNFENLQQNTKIKSQKLLCPTPLVLSPSDELTVIDNIEVLGKNGFHISVKEEEEEQDPINDNNTESEMTTTYGRRKVMLEAIPISQSTVFNTSDLDELIHLLQENNVRGGETIRCSKAKMMFASRACRRSIMIGDALTLGQMSLVVKNMATLEQPWNCPHGRPTMRHLACLLSSIPDDRNKKTLQEVVPWSKLIE